MNRKVVFAPGEYYHLYNRGVDKRIIFTEKVDYQRFLALLYLCNTTESIRTPKDFRAEYKDVFTTPRKEMLVDICAYCLMPNHFHLLIKEKSANGISLFMQKLTTAYTMYFNARHERSGALFQGVFKSQHALDDRYLKYLISYVHLNPVKLVESGWKAEGLKNKKRAEEFLENYEYSSYRDFNGLQRFENSIVSRGILPEYFDTPLSFKESMREWLAFNEMDSS